MTTLPQQSKFTVVRQVVHIDDSDEETQRKPDAKSKLGPK